jgi:8-oxo-dGTP diphosphatase
MSAAGQPVLDTGILKTEKGDRRVDVDELVAFAAVLGTSPNELLGPWLRARGIPVDCELTPGWAPADAADVWAWLTGEKPLPNGDTPRREAEFVTANRPHHFGGGHWRLSRGAAVAYSEAEQALSAAIRDAFRNDLTPTELRSIFEQTIVEALAERDGQTGAQEPAAATALQPVVAAIVTSDLGVLVGRRNDRTPPWTFITGEVEPGELPEDAAVREVKEETGLEVRAGQVIGERNPHPATGRHMIYMAAEPTRGTGVFVGDEAELAEVRWVYLAEADELLRGMFGPVREYLERTLSSGREG